MTHQHRAQPWQWATQEAFRDADGDASCILELRDRIVAMDACIWDIYKQLDRLKTYHENNWARIVNLEDGLAVAKGAASAVDVTDEALLELMPESMRDEFSNAAKVCSDATGGQVKPRLFRVCLNTTALEYARVVYNLGLEHGEAHV
jgi:hypothetical protein